MTTISELFETVARRFPNHEACVVPGASISYGRLLERVESLANHLHSAGIGPGNRVALMMPGGIDLVVAVLATLRSGAAYVPVDPRYPQQKRQRLLAAGRPDLLLYGANCPSSEPSAARVPARPEDAACVLFTSGTLGHVKGVVITNRSLANLAGAASTEFGLEPAARFLLMASLSFSASLEELFPPLVSGACVVFPDPKSAVAHSVDGLLAEINRNRITHVELQTGIWQRLVFSLADTHRDLPGSLRLVIMGGERHLPIAVHEWARLARIPLIHVYGPTEATATVSYHRLEPGEVPENHVIPIGTPIRGARCYVVGPDRLPVTMGETGELYVGGDCLAAGYFEQPAETLEKFQPDPRLEPGGGPLYRTGDLVREISPRVLEYVARTSEHDVPDDSSLDVPKIERSIGSHPDVGAVLVVPQKDYWGELQLVAYVSPRRERLSVGEIQEHARRVLTDSARLIEIVKVDALPRDPSGRLDRRALPAPSHDRSVRRA